MMEEILSGVAGVIIGGMLAYVLYWIVQPLRYEAETLRKYKQAETRAVIRAMKGLSLNKEIELEEKIKEEKSFVRRLEEKVIKETFGEDAPK